MTTQDTNALPDTRPDFRATTAWVGTVIDAVRPDQLDAPTPCADWAVRDLLGHVVVVLDRLTAIGQGADPFSVPSTMAVASEVGDADWARLYAEGLARWEKVWSDDDVLARPVTAPWGAMPGAMVLGGYVFEYLTHGWDLARATGQDAEAPAGLAERALPIARMVLPAERRGDDTPFGAPITPRAEAGATEQLANWLGRAA